MHKIITNGVASPQVSTGKDHTRGFALIATISVMVLLVMVALSMLSLSTVELRQSRNADAQSEAQANARMALMIALGELQKNMGPDQRVSVEAAMFDTSVTSHDKIDGVKNPHWVAVYSTLHEDGASMISRNVNRGGEWDRRTKPDRTGQWETDWQHGNRHRKALTYLVSGNEGHTRGTPVADYQDAVATALADRDSVEIVKMDYPTNDPRRVRVKLVSTGEKDSAGSYAWWVRDLGAAAKVSVADAYAGKKANPNSPSDGGYYRILAAAETPGKFIDSSLDLKAGDVTKIVDTPQLQLVSNPAKAAFKERWFDITAHGFGVLTNVRTGKLRRNLSDYLNRSGNSGSVGIASLTSGGKVVSPGISDTDYLLGVPNEATLNWIGKSADSVSWAAVIAKRKDTTPRFTTLREYARLADQVVFRNGQSSQVWSEEVSGPPGAGSYDGQNNMSIRLRNPSKHSLQPILTESTLYFNISSFPTTVNGSSVHRLRAHFYPRVTLWNPYNVSIEMERMSVWFQTTGNRNIQVKTPTGTRQVDMYLGTSGGVLEGSLYFTLEATTLKPGECLVFSPKSSSLYRTTFLNKNLLSANSAPDVGKSLYWDADRGAFRGGTITEGGKTFNRYDFEQKPQSWFQQGGPNAEDVRVVMKKYAGNIPAFIASPMVLVVSGSPKIGANEETPLTWNSSNPVPMAQSQKGNASINQLPDARTRESIRLRWLEEPQSNLVNSGISNLDDAENLFASSYFANWNLRAGFIIKSPFSNMAPREPFFHGIYSRDIGGPESSWNAHTPPSIGGKVRGNPFGYHQDALSHYVLYDIPRKETGLVSLAQFQHAKLTDYSWQTGSAIGHSFADPRMERYRTVPSPKNNQYGGWNATYYGNNSDYTASLARGMIHHVAGSERVVYDLSHNANRALWDDFFLASNTADALDDFLADPERNPLPNSRLHLLVRGRSNPQSQDLDFHRAARWLVTDGAFNVNSTSVRAWRALLSATRDSGMGEHAFPSILNAPEGGYKTGDDAFTDKSMAGYRDLTEYEIEELAEKIVEQVKLRGPFLSLADFVNRRLVDDETGLMGTLQAAIEATNVNTAFRAGPYQIENYKELPDYSVNTLNLNGISDSTNLFHTLKPQSKLAGAPGYLTQADLLQTIGSAVSARSDCFMIRAYGESKDASGKVLAKAYCEAVVQRLPDPVIPEDQDYKLNPATPASGKADYGRRFIIQSFRWLSPDEV